MGGHSHWSTIKRQKGASDAKRGQLFTKLSKESTVAARDRGAGGAEAEALVEATFEGYGPGGVAILLQVVTDNRNRTVSEIRTTLTRNGGNLGETGSVARQFDNVGYIP